MRWLVAALLAILLLAPVRAAAAAPARQSETDTPTPTETATPTETPVPSETPTPTGTPAYVTSFTLDSGNTLIVERRWTFGELGIFLAILANTAVNGLRWIYEITRREGRETTEVKIAN